MSEEIEHLKREAIHWKFVASYLADCCAATAEYEGKLKRTSQSSQERFKRICEKAADYLEGKHEPPTYGAPKEAFVNSAIDRCRKAAMQL